MDFRHALDQYVGDAATQQQVRERLDAMLSRSTTDRAFRRKLVESPREAIAEFQGVDVSAVPANATMRFIESDGTPTIILPAWSGNGEIAEEELEAVSGGNPFLIGVIVGLMLAK